MCVEKMGKWPRFEITVIRLEYILSISTLTNTKRIFFVFKMNQLTETKSISHTKTTLLLVHWFIVMGMRLEGIHGNEAGRPAQEWECESASVSSLPRKPTNRVIDHLYLNICSDAKKKKPKKTL